MEIRFTVFSNGSLFVKNVTKAVEGMYSCVGVRKECENYPSKYTAILSIASKDCFLNLIKFIAFTLQRHPFFKTICREIL